MNTDQFQSIIRTVLKIISGLLVAHGMSDTAGILNAPDVIGAILLVASLIWSHYAHGDDAPPSLPKAPLLMLALALAGGFMFAGCAGTPNKIAFQAAGVTNLSVDTALGFYDQAAAAGKTTPAQNLAVKNAWEKYHAAYLLTLDAGKAATTSTNSAALFANAVDEMAYAKADIINLLVSFGVIKQ